MWYNYIMTQNDQTSTEPQLCIKCKEMYGNKNFNDMCSMCFK